MNYSFTCPIKGCNQEMIVEAKDDKEAVKKLSQKAKEHLVNVHPDIHKTDDQIQSDVSSLMTKKDL